MISIYLGLETGALFCSALTSCFLEHPLLLQPCFGVCAVGAVSTSSSLYTFFCSESHLVESVSGFAAGVFGQATLVSGGELETWVRCYVPYTWVALSTPGVWDFRLGPETCIHGVNLEPGFLEFDLASGWAWSLSRWRHSWVLDLCGLAWCLILLGRCGAGVCGDVGCTLHSSSSLVGVSLHAALPGVGGGVMWVIWDCLWYPFQCIFSYFCVSPGCFNFSPGIFSSYEGNFAWGYLFKLMLLQGDECYKLLFCHLINITLVSCLSIE